MKNSLKTIFFSTFLLTLLMSGSVSSVTLRDGVTYFQKPPRLLSVTSSRDGSFVWGANYYFTIRISESSDEPVRRVVILQQSGGDSPQFEAKHTKAFEGTREKRGKSLKLKDVVLDSSPMELSVIFDPPVPPGKTFTIQLFPVRNPIVGGNYLYRVTAFPPGAKPFGQFLGLGQIRIVDRNRD